MTGRSDVAVLGRVIADLRLERLDEVGGFAADHRVHGVIARLNTLTIEERRDLFAHASSHGDYLTRCRREHERRYF